MTDHLADALPSDPDATGAGKAPAGGAPTSPQAPPKKKGDLLPRVLTAVVMVPVLLALIFVGPAWLWAAFILAATAVGLYEYYGMTLRAEPPYVRVVAAGIGTAFAVALYAFVGAGAPVELGGHQTTALFGLLAAIVWSVYLFNLFRPRDIAQVANTTAASIAGVLYVAMPFAFVAMLKRDLGNDGPGLVLLVLGMAWLSDTTAYFAGRAFGRHKLAPIVSPKKTVEGALGGLAGTVAITFALRALLLPWMGLVDTIVLALVANVLGQAGDLCESLVKRSTGVKDSGTIIHGHGGMLDRVDAVLFLAPWVYLYAVLADGGVLLG